MAEAGLKMTALIGETVAMLGYVPAILPTVVSERNFDALSYHRLGVIKDAAVNFRRAGTAVGPDGKAKANRGAQKFVASRLFRYARKDNQPPKTLADAKGEGFAAEPNPGEFGAGGLETLEAGRTITTSRPMAIGFGGGKIDTATLALLKYLPKGRVLLKIEKGKKGVSRGARSQLFSLRRRRVAKPLLGYYKRWETNLPKVLGKFEGDLAKVLTEAGRASLAQRTREADAKRVAYVEAQRAFLAGSPGMYSKARAAGKRAADAVKRDALAGGGGA